jgi:hypothetical protein
MQTDSEYMGCTAASEIKSGFLDTDTKISYPYPPKNFVYEKGLAAQPKILSGQAVLLQKRVCVSLYLYSLCYRGL